MLAASKPQVVKRRGDSPGSSATMQQAGSRGLEVRCPQHTRTAEGQSPPQGQSPCPVTPWGLRGRGCPAGTVHLHLRQGQPCCCVCGCACVCACWKHGECFNYVKLLGSWTGRGTAVRVLIQEDDVCGVVWTYVSISVHTASSLCPKCP